MHDFAQFYHKSVWVWVRYTCGAGKKQVVSGLGFVMDIKHNSIICLS